MKRHFKRLLEKVLFAFVAFFGIFVNVAYAKDYTNKLDATITLASGEPTEFKGNLKTNELPPKPYKESPKVDVSGELLFRYERQITKSDSLKRPPKGSQHSLSISVGE